MTKGTHVLVKFVLSCNSFLGARMVNSVIYLLRDHQSPVAEQIVDLGFAVEVFETTRGFLEHVSKHPRHACAVFDLKTDFDQGSFIQEKALADRICMPFVFIVDHASANFAVSVVRRGAISVLERPVDSTELNAALDVALMSADSYRAFAESGSYCVRLATLSDRERRIVQLAADGLPNKRIASILGLSVKTVEKQRRQAYRRLCVTSTAEMTRAVTLGNLHPLLASTVATTT